MDKKLKVAVFNTQPPHLYYGGVERRIIDIAKRLTNEVETTVYSGTKRGFKKTTTINGTTLVPCYSTDIVYPLDNWVFNRSISKKVDEIETDVYEAHNVSGYKFLRKLKKRKSSKPFIQTIHGVLAEEYIQSTKNVSQSLRMKLASYAMKHLAGIEESAARDATLIVTVSRYSAQKIVELYGVDETKIRVVPNGVDSQRFKPIEDSNKVKESIDGDSKHLVLFVGNLIPRKGIHFLIEAAKQVTKEDEETKFVVVGNGPLKDQLINYAKELGVANNFIFMQNIDDAALPAIYNCADIFVSPSIQEGQGITLLEAQATAKPVVAFDVAAVNEVVKNNETGLLVNPDSKELADSILKLLSNELLREKMGRSGRKIVSENFSLDVCAQKMLKVYSEAKDM